MSARAARRLPWRPRVRPPHLCVDRRKDALYWVGSRAGREGLKPESWGSIPLDDGMDRPADLAALAASARSQRARVEVSLCSDDLVHRRSELPELSAREARKVAERRSEAMRSEMDHESRCVWLRRSGGAGAIWFCAAPTAETERSVVAWHEDGFEVHRLHSRHLALGNLARVLPPPPPGTLLAVFDLEHEYGTCVVMDSQGWVFSRQIPLRFMGERVLRQEPPKQAPAAAPEPQGMASSTVELELELDGDASQLLLEDEAKPDDAMSVDLDPMERLASHAERLQTELRRTFGYVRGELGLDPIGRVVLAGESPDLHSLLPMLSQGLEVPVGHLCDELPAGLSGVAPGAAVALGMALSPAGDGGNLVSPLTIRTRAIGAARSRLVGALVLASLLFAVFGARHAFRLHGFRATSTSIEQRWAEQAELRAETEAVLAARQRAAALAAMGEAIVRPQPSWTGLLETLGRLAPATTVVEQLHVHREATGEWLATITVESTAFSVSEAARSISDYAQSLDLSPLARTDHIQREEIGRREVDAGLERVRFRFDARLAPIASAAGDWGEPSAASEARAVIEPGGEVDDG